jgi:hypothetical protein
MARIVERSLDSFPMITYSVSSEEMRAFTEELRESGFILEDRLKKLSRKPTLIFLHPDARNLGDRTQPLFGFGAVWDTNYGTGKKPAYKLEVFAIPAAGDNVRHQYNIFKHAFETATNRKYPFN